jgi:hypothetical protein
VALEVEAAWRSVESNFGDADFTRDEWRVSPFVEYALDRRAELRWWPVDPDAVRIRGGVVFARADGDFGGAALEQNRDFALLLGAGALWAGGWTLDVAAALFGGEEREFSLGIHRIF